MKLTNFKKYAGPVITRRAKAYLEEGRVHLVEEDVVSGLYRYSVDGTDSYRVELHLDGEEVVKTTCNCPYSGMCKHVTAALMDVRERLSASDAVAAEGTVTTISDGMDAAKGAAGPTVNELGLTESEMFTLCYIAFSGSESYNYSFANVEIFGVRKLRLTQKAFNDNKKSLRKGKWMSQTGGTFPVDPSKIIAALIMLVRDYSDWLAFFELYFKQPAYLLYLTDVAKVIVGIKLAQVHYYKPELYYYGNAESYVLKSLLSILDNVTPEQMSAFMDDYVMCELADILLERVLEQDSLSDLDTVATLISLLNHHNARSAAIFCRFRLATFYAKAEVLPERPSSRNYHETFYLDASTALLTGDVASAVNFFQKGLKIQNKHSRIKNIPDDSISFFLYIVALSIRRSAKDVAALSGIVKKRHDIQLYGSSLAFPLAAFSATSDQTIEDSFIVSASHRYPGGEGDAMNVIAALTACFFGFKGKWKQAFPDPKMGVLRNECAHYFGGSLSAMAPAWPYDAVLPRIPVRAPWELQIEELLNQVGNCSLENATLKESEKRLYYVASYYSRCVEVREQGRLAGGAWSKGKKLSFIRYKTGDCPMDEIDKQIYAEWLKGDPGFERHYAQCELPTLELVLSHLVGTDKLAVESRGPLCLAEVIEEKPFLWTEKRDGEIFFGTNIPENAREYSSMYVCTPDAAKYVVYRMPHELIQAFKRILSIGHLPAESEPMLEKLFAALKGRLEVHSDIAGGVSLARHDASVVVTVRVEPVDDMFMLTAVARPSEDGVAVLFPAEGNEIVYDTLAGERVELMRNMKKEASNLRKVNALLPEGNAFSPEHPSCVMDAADLLDFMEGATLMPSVAALEWPEGQALKLHFPKTSTWEINAVGKGGWFELEGNLSVSDEKMLSVQQLLSLLRESKGRFVRIGEKEYIQLSDNIRRQLERIDMVSQEYHGRLRVPQIAMAVMGEDLSGDIAIDEPEVLLEMRSRVRRSRDIVFDVPEGLNASLRYYQEEGFQWLMRVSSWGAGACLADDMGLGKTVQAIAFLLAHAAEGPSMVVAPASVVSNWQREISRFAPSMRTHVLSGLSSETRTGILATLAAGDVLLITYGLLASESQRLAELSWNVVCLDEAHTIKNRDTKSSSAAMKLNASRRLILTGTPVQNHLGELWNLFRFINPGLLGTYEQFSKKFMSGGQASAMELKRIVAPFLLRRTKQEVVRELPDKEEIVVPVELSEDEAAVYENIRREAVNEVEGASSLSVNALSMITKLRMAACSASLAENQWPGTGCSKIEAFMDKLLPIVEGGNSVLVFSQFTSFLGMAAAALAESGFLDYLYLDGQTPVSKRQEMVDSFQRGEHKVFFISLKAGGLGLNLTGANYVIHLDPWWNPAIEQQATDRAYRIGQIQKVTVYHLISSNTIEEKILRLHATKRNLADSLLAGSATNSRLTPDEVLDMICTGTGVL